MQDTERNECSMVERVGELKKTSCESYEPKRPCNMDNVDVEPEIIPETVAQKSKGPSRLFNIKKFLPSQTVAQLFYNMCTKVFTLFVFSRFNIILRIIFYLIKIQSQTTAVILYSVKINFTWKRMLIPDCEYLFF